MDEEIPFPVETMWVEASFTVHKFWPHLHVNTQAMVTSIIENCPEVLGKLPPDLVERQKVWRDIVCTARVNRFAFEGANNTTLNFNDLCAQSK